MKPPQVPVVDADGHYIKAQEQVARHLDEPFNRRSLSLPMYPSDGWDRRLLGTLGDRARDADSWLRALERGGVEPQTCMEPGPSEGPRMKPGAPY